MAYVPLYNETCPDYAPLIAVECSSCIQHKTSCPNQIEEYKQQSFLKYGFDDPLDHFIQKYPVTGIFCIK